MPANLRYQMIKCLIHIRFPGAFNRNRGARARAAKSLLGRPCVRAKLDDLAKPDILAEVRARAERQRYSETSPAGPKTAGFFLK